MTEKPTIPCPECGAPMNCHAEKLDPSRDSDGELGGVVLEIHACPACQFVLERETR
ncbi:MAG TPA: hypothetical protein VIY96_11930 [Thermoanaerobaculia bacterium]